MKIYNVLFGSWDGSCDADSVTVSTLKEINIPFGVKLYTAFPFPKDVLKFLEDAFEEYKKATLEDDLVFRSLSEVDVIIIYEVEFPLI